MGGEGEVVRGFLGGGGWIKIYVKNTVKVADINLFTEKYKNLTKKLDFLFIFFFN